MNKTRKLPYSKTVPMVPVTGLRIAGRNRVYKFDRRCNEDGTVTIGRTGDREIRIRKDDTVSKLHCVIYKNERGRYEVVDAESTNGIEISDTAPYKRYVGVWQCELTVGMRVKVGDTRLIIVGPDGEPVIAASRFSLIGKVALSIFGNISAAAKRLRLDDRRFKKIAEKDGDEVEKDEGDEDE